jgi:nucleotide-binding universal stress UspA family protein
MRVLCCLDGSNTEQLHRACSLLPGPEGRHLGLLYVMDTVPRHELEWARHRFLRQVPPRPDRLEAVDRRTAEDILREAAALLPGAETHLREGRPEWAIVETSVEWRADLVVVCARSRYDTVEMIGPGSVGHVARFVVDHAPCPVLLLRASLS